jgi:hypothetical protein
MANFAIGDGSLFATGTAGVTGIVCKASNPFPIEYLIGLLNSELLALYTVSHSPIYQGGFHKFSAPYLRNIPIVVPVTSEQRTIQERIVGLVNTISATVLRSREMTSVMEQRFAQRLISGAKVEIDRHVLTLYQLDENSRSWIEKRAAQLGLR